MLDGHDWISVHAFSHAGTGPLVAGAVAPQLRHWQATGRVRNSFYLNHWEGGPHVRVRLLPTDPADAGALQRDLTSALQAYLAGRSGRAMPPEQYRQLVEQGQALERGASDLPLHPDGTVVPWAYRPEWERFGGPERAASVIRVFGVSSALAGAVNEADWSAPRRISLALQGALWTLHRVIPSGQALLDALSHAARFWSASPGDAFQPPGVGMNALPRTEDSALRRWTAELLTGAEPRTHPFARTLSDEIQRHVADPGSESASMALDLLHLHHNRLGFSVWHEARTWTTLLQAVHHTIKGERYAH
ncbi:lantibiotic dehydratase C-terminal domain-containing protein [Deinococcus aquiradiocola]|uniref:Thiopeptide-type bacteriocin biosynthesis domain-containing protein n=1 Tax=Deinococcus aquiradiocola TaxID=393059 RepID=A0A917UM05_9DEIO|nr:lantibiotic dehydratase C-terminal domain-containing protein [Deinococcus aquiradiocola]GGJ67213.1 hypothetical protein GCM10008939_09340 [Deinococcus aquiradiocola]